MAKAIQDFLFGLCFGVGFAVAFNVVTFIGQFFQAPALHSPSAADRAKQRDVAAAIGD